MKMMKAYKIKYLAAETRIAERRIWRISTGTTRMYFDEGIAILKACRGGDDE